MHRKEVAHYVLYLTLHLAGLGSNGVTVTGLHKVTAIFSNCIVTGLHFQNKECNGTWGYLMGEKLRYSTYVCHQK